MKSVHVAILTVLIAASLMGTAAARTPGVAHVSAHVNARVLVTTSPGALLIQANTPWTLAIETPNGVDIIYGAKTAGELVHVPEDCTGYWVTEK